MDRKLRFWASLFGKGAKQASPRFPETGVEPGLVRFLNGAFSGSCRGLSNDTVSTERCTSCLAVSLIPESELSFFRINGHRSAWEVEASVFRDMDTMIAMYFVEI